MNVPDRIKRLIETFDNNLESYKKGIYNETQVRRYGWSAKLPLCILTDFEELSVYDCRVKPVKTDKVSHYRILYLEYTDYEVRWEEITGIFSRDAILNEKNTGSGTDRQQLTGL